MIVTELIAPTRDLPAFRRRMCSEYFDRASFGYDRFTYLREKTFARWTDVRAFHLQYEAMIDGLVVAGEDGIAFLQDKIERASPGDLNAIARVFLRHGRFELIQDLLEKTWTEAHIQAFGQALGQEPTTPEFERSLIDVALDANDSARRIAIKTLGYRRISDVASMERVIQTSTGDVLLAAVEAYGRMVPENPDVIALFLRSKDQDLSRTAARALLHAGDYRGGLYCLMHGKDRPDLLPLLGVGGPRQSTTDIMAWIEDGCRHPEALMALGLLGSPECIDLLIQFLSDPELKEAAAQALYIITGIGQIRRGAGRSELMEAEVFEDEKQWAADMQAPEAPNRIVRYLDSGLGWKSWWTRHKKSLTPTMYFRSGRRVKPSVLAEDLLNPDVPQHLRDLYLLELSVRYKIDMEIELDMSVQVQEQQLNEFLVTGRSSLWSSGFRYFNGAGQN